MKKILHICTDEKFIDFAIKNFNSIGYVENAFLIITNNKTLRYIKSQGVTVKSKASFLLGIFFGYLKGFDAVIFHSMPDLFKFYLKFFPANLTVCWIGFGFDYYVKKYSNQRKLSLENRFKKNMKKKLLRLDYSYVKVDYFCPVLESEFEPASKRLKLKADYIDWNYGISNELIKSLQEDYVRGNSILLGNSADSTNNHLEILEKLNSVNEQREVVIPLSYGGNSEYIDSLLTFLKNSNLKYFILKDFVSQDEYFKILKRCSFVIMNHKRQQAAGNIVMMLSLGAKVILDKNNPLYDFFTDLGFELFEKTNLKKELSFRLQEGTARLNKKSSIDHFNDVVTKNKTKNLIDILTAKK